MKNYIMNRETGKIELHFEKSEYANMSDDDKNLLKKGFVWGRKTNAWISRAKFPNLWRAKDIAKQLGFEGEEQVGERLSFAEQLERKAAKAEARADRYEHYAENAEKRAEGLQSEFNRNKGDIAWLTQPNINSSAGRAFTRQRDRIMDRYEKGFDEYRKSEYFKDRAETAKRTASMTDLKNPIYLENRIEEARKEIRKLDRIMVKYEEMLYDIENGADSVKSAEDVKDWIDDLAEQMEAVMDKEGFYLNCLDDIGGIKFSKENLKPGYIIKVARYGRCEVIKANPKTVEYRILDGGAAGMFGRCGYSAVQDILEEREAKKEEEHNYKVGDILVQYNISGNVVLYAYRVMKTTPKTISIAMIPLKDGKPDIEADPIKKAFVRKPYINKWDGQWQVAAGDWPLYKWNEKEEKKA